jgi:hypothetical protein
MDDLIVILIALFVSMYIVYFLVNQYASSPYSIIEGLESRNPDATGNGEAASAATYAASINANFIKLQDELLIPKYRKDYESIIINMDDYISMLMLKQVLNIDIDLKDNNMKPTTERMINRLSILKSSKDALNDIMKFVDKQQ